MLLHCHKNWLQIVCSIIWCVCVCVFPVIEYWMTICSLFFFFFFFFFHAYCSHLPPSMMMIMIGHLASISCFFGFVQSINLFISIEFSLNWTSYACSHFGKKGSTRVCNTKLFSYVDIRTRTFDLIIEQLLSTILRCKRLFYLCVCVCATTIELAYSNNWVCARMINKQLGWERKKKKKKKERRDTIETGHKSRNR